MVTGDRDLFQLVSADTRVVYIAKSIVKGEIVDQQWIAERYGIPENRYIDYSVLRGDPSDGLPGLKGIGEKTAAALVRSYPSLDDMVAAASRPDSGLKPAQRRSLLSQRDYLNRARTVVNAVSDLHIPAIYKPKENSSNAKVLAEKFGLGSSFLRLSAQVDDLLSS